MNDFYKPIETLLPKVDELMLTQLGKPAEAIYHIMAPVIQAGGKRIRAGLSLLAGKLCGISDDSSINIAAAVELLHTATLVHDDLIDKANTRRGIPTINSKWPASVPVLMGDYIFAVSADLAAQTGSVELINDFTQTLKVIVEGEISQVFQSPSTTHLDRYYDRIYAKTASLIELAASAPALLASDEQKTTCYPLLKSFGKNLGMAFQIQDDILDYIGDQKQTGKPVGADLQQGILTLPVILYLEENEKSTFVHGFLEDSRKKKHLSRLSATRLIHKIKKSGVIERSYHIANNYKKSAFQILEQIPDSSIKNSLSELTEFVTSRNL
ncbi:MAG: polyprenyl synthetase family protein [Anaerolineales bacterium]|nr:polyprenyl synthetase family protein [Anaerolineales bacterium]